jgi:OmpA-OmpF porin, OOP family
MPDASRMYFTLCRDEAMQDCEIWYRDREYEGTWGVAVKLPEAINLKGANTTQPAIGWDASTRKYTLFFASNRPGGHGKMDIWASTITWDGKFEAPVCLPFNTPEDEVTPSYSQTGQTLFFSSNGLKGQGRFDVHSVKKADGGKWGQPQNLGRPFNTAYDDLFYTYHESSQTGYLASDRPGSQCTGSTDGFNCFDIYEVKKSIPNLKGSSTEIR